MNPSPPVPIDEAARLARLHALLVLDTEPEPLFDTLARQAAALCGAPVALLSLVDAERQWFKANVGLGGVQQTPRDQAFCAWTILGDEVFEVDDAGADPRFAANPLVTGEPGIRFYAGAPLCLADGGRVGSLCVIDRQPRRLSDAQRTALRDLAALASQALAMRRDLLARALLARSAYEDELQAARQHWQALVEDQSELVSLARTDGTLVYVNAAYARHFARPAQALIGSNLFELIEPHDRAAVRAQIDEVLRSGRLQSGENRMTAADGSERWVAWTNTMHSDAVHGRLLHSVGRDITERRRAELALRASQALLESTGRVAGVGGWQLELDSGHLLWSAQTRRIHEVADDFVPTLDNAVAFYAPEGRGEIEAAVARGMQTGQPWDLELPLVTAAGRRIWVRAQGKVEFEAGRPVRLLGAFQDVTERRALEQRVAESERFLRQLADNLPLRIGYLDRERRYRFANRELLRRFGRSRDEVLGRTRAELLSDADDAAVAEPARAALAGQAQHFEFEELVEGQQRRFENRLIPDLADSGEVRGYFLTGIDITERSAAQEALRALTAIFDNTTDFVVQADARGQVLYMNPSVRRALGLASDAPVAQLSVASFNTPATNRLFVEQIVPAVKRGEVWVGPTTVYLAGRREVPVSHMVIGHFDAAGRIERYSAVMRDISAAVSAEQQILRQSATLRSVADAIPATVAVTDPAGCYSFVNRAFEREYGLPAGRILGRSAREVLGEAEYERRRPWIERALAGEAVAFDLGYTDGAGERHLQISYIPLRRESGEPDGFVVVGQDISGHKRETSQLREQALRDPLTGLLNRAGFEQAVGLMRRSEATLALLYIDLDHFKPVNDRHGHPAGDALLRAFGERLSRLVRPTDAVARLGGDEFAVALPGMQQAAQAQAVAAKVLAAAVRPFAVGPLQLQIGASVGVAFGADPAQDWHELVARADAALLQAKAAGRGRASLSPA
ncbi:MAG: PAS domain-containing protein [Burkholderiales bacterium]|nr:PAS domain-containing protein [Burkholderiales bacterium]